MPGHKPDLSVISRHSRAKMAQPGESRSNKHQYRVTLFYLLNGMLTPSQGIPMKSPPTPSGRTSAKSTAKDSGA